MTTHLAPSPACFAPPDGVGLGGLLAGGSPLPLREVRVRTRIAGAIAVTVVEQRFHNPGRTPVEAVHIFPLPAEAAVRDVELVAGDLVVKADLRRRDEAEAAFREAARAGHRAALLTAERDDVHTLRVARLPPGEDVRVRIELVELLEGVDGRLRWRFPTTIAPRYVPGAAAGHAGPGVEPDTDAAPDASRLTPPLRLAGGVQLDLEVIVETPVRAVESSLHALQVSRAEGGFRIVPDGTVTCDRDFVLALSAAGDTRAAASAWTDGAATVVVVEPPLVDPGTTNPRDAVFVIDISGSMSGPKLDAAKRALTAALHGLDPRDRFRLLAFDDRVERFDPGPSPLDDRTLARADAWIAALRARGGTEMLPPLREALDGDTPEGRVRTVLFVTDGQAANDAAIAALCSSAPARTHLFTLGIDTAVNDALLRRMARLGGGTCELCTPDDDIEAVLTRLEVRFGAPLAEVQVEGAPAERLFAGRAAVLFVPGAPAAVAVRAGEQAWMLTPTPTTTPVATLAARRRIQRLDDRLVTHPWEEEAVRAEVVRLALAARLASRWTAWVAVERTRQVEGELVEVVVPVELPHDWAEGFAMLSPPVRRPQGLAMNRMAVGDVARKRAAPPPPAPLAAPVPAAPPASQPDASSFHDVARSPAPAPGRAAGAAPPPDPTGALARTQRADGSWNGDETETCRALVTLLRAGNTARSGPRQRVVAKALAWLRGRAGSPLVDAVVALAERMARGAPYAEDPLWASTSAASPVPGARPLS